MVADASSTTLLCILSSFARNFPARYLDGEFERKREKRFDIKFERERERHLEEQWKDIGWRKSQWNDGSLPQTSCRLSKAHFGKFTGFENVLLEQFLRYKRAFHSGNRSLISRNRVENALARAKTRLTLVRRGEERREGKRSKRRLVVTRQKLLGRRAFHSA